MKPDEGHNLTEKELAKLERRIASVYGEAAKELQETVESYFKQFEKRDAEMKELIGTVVNGKEWTERDYKQWRLNQIGRGERFKALQKRVAERYTKANKTAVSYVNDATPSVYTLNRNYAAYTIESVAGDVGFELWDEQTVKRLIKEEPDLMPYYPAKRALNRGIDLAYGKRQISACVTSSILQGKSIKGMADDLQTRIPTMNRDSAIRTARTAVTNAQNAGRMDSYVAATKMGIEMEREWVSALDARTRPEHAEADGQVVGVDKPFVVGGEKLMFPGDRSGSGWNIYNCRCTQIAKVKGVDTSDAKRRARDPETGESVLIENMSYAEWAGWKNKQQKIFKIDDAKSIKDVENAFRDRDWFIHGEGELNGWRSDEFLSLDGLDVESAKYVYSTYEKLFDKFPQLKNKLAAPISAKLDMTTIAVCTMGFGNGLVNISKRKFANYEKIKMKIKKEFDSGWCSSTDIIMHELGHAVDDYMSCNLHLFGVQGKKETDFVSNKVRAQILRESGIKLGDIKNEVSEYATTNAHEWFAECFAEYMTSDSPRKCAKNLGKWIEKQICGDST